jgi:hypothetical protein
MKRRNSMCGPFSAAHSRSRAETAAVRYRFLLFSARLECSGVDEQTKALYEIRITGETACLILHDNFQNLFP